MNRTRAWDGRDAQRPPSSIKVPIGWQRKVDRNMVFYISPSGSVLACSEQVRSYLLTDGTCKCGLECPLILPKVFNFDPGATVRQQTAEDMKADENVTKLCIHKRKIIAVATLHKNLTPHPTVTTKPLSGAGFNQIGALMLGAAKKKLQEALSNSPAPDRKSLCNSQQPTADHRGYQLGTVASHQHDPYSRHNRKRLGSSNHAGQKAPYRNHYGVLLSPAAVNRSQLHLDGSHSPRGDPLGGLGVATVNFRGTCSPVAARINGLSHLTTSIHAPPAVTQVSCALDSRTNVPPSPTFVTTKSSMMMNSCIYPKDGCHRKAPPGSPSPPQLPPCTLQTKQVTSEKDPLGILDPILSPSATCASLLANPHGLQPSAHPHIPQMNVSVHSSIVTLRSSLPIPSGHPEPFCQSNSTKHNVAPSMSPSPGPSPGHMSGPNRYCSPTAVSSGRGSFPSSTGLQAYFGTALNPSRSPKTSLGSSLPVTPLSAILKHDLIQHQKGNPNRCFRDLNNAQGKHVGHKNTTESGSVKAPQKHYHGQVDQTVQHSTSSTFPASNLLSAAAKGQFANQSTPFCKEESMGTLGSCAGLEGRVRTLEDNKGINTMFAPKRSPFAEGQSGRDALRDKLMAQQRGALNRNKPINSSHSMAISSLQVHGGGPEDTRGLSQQPRSIMSNSTMSQPLQSMSSQNSFNGHEMHSPEMSDQGSLKERLMHLGPSFQSPQRPMYFQAQMGLSQNQSSNGEVVHQGPTMGSAKHLTVPISSKEFWMQDPYNMVSFGTMSNQNLYPQKLNHHHNPQDMPGIQGNASVSSVSNGYTPGLAGKISLPGSDRRQCRQQGQSVLHGPLQSLAKICYGRQGCKDRPAVSEGSFKDGSSPTCHPRRNLHQSTVVSASNTVLMPVSSQQETMHCKEKYPELFGSSAFLRPGRESVSSVDESVVDSARVRKAMEITVTSMANSGSPLGSLSNEPLINHQDVRSVIQGPLRLLYPEEAPSQPSPWRTRQLGSDLPRSKVSYKNLSSHKEGTLWAPIQWVPEGHKKGVAGIPMRLDKGYNGLFGDLRNDEHAQNCCLPRHYQSKVERGQFQGHVSQSMQGCGLAKKRSRKGGKKNNFEAAIHDAMLNMTNKDRSAFQHDRHAKSVNRGKISR